MIAVTHLLLPALLALLAAVPASFALAMCGTRGAKAALTMLTVAILVNIALPLAAPETEFAGAGAAIALLIAILAPLSLVTGWHFGNFVRERRKVMPQGID